MTVHEGRGGGDVPGVEDDAGVDDLGVPGGWLNGSGLHDCGTADTVAEHVHGASGARGCEHAVGAVVHGMEMVTVYSVGQEGRTEVECPPWREQP